MVTFLISATIWGAALINGSAYSDLSVNGAALIRGRYLFEAQCLLEEIQ